MLVDGVMSCGMAVAVGIGDKMVVVRSARSAAWGLAWLNIFSEPGGLFFCCLDVLFFEAVIEI